MHWVYTCPHCKGTLNPDDSVVLVAENAGKRILIGLHPEPGVYTMHTSDESPTSPGSRWLFRCPLCHADLRSDLSDDLACLDMTCSGEPHRVHFSRICGEEATFVVSAEGLMHDHGIHTDQYVEAMVHKSFR